MRPNAVGPSRVQMPRVQPRASGRRASNRSLSGSGELAPEVVSHRVHVRPAEAAAAEQHVAYQRLDGCLADQPHEEQLFYHLAADRAEGREPQQQLAEPDGLVGVLRPTVLLEGALRLLLQTLDVGHVRQPARVCNREHRFSNTGVVRYILRVNMVKALNKIPQETITQQKAIANILSASSVIEWFEGTVRSLREVAFGSTAAIPIGNLTCTPLDLMPPTPHGESTRGVATAVSTFTIPVSLL